jgi:hypothetical protein
VNERPDIEGNISAYLGARKQTDRYTSFDYCFNYFQSHWEENRVADLAKGDALQASCLHLGFYLASWGMYRGSTVLLQRSLAYLAPVVQAIASAPADIWLVDADAYSRDGGDLVLRVGQLLRRAFREGATDTLVTKVMLGVFGCVPAFDANFVSGAGLRTFNHASLRELGRFYSANREAIDRHRVATLDFATGLPSSRRYTRSKVIDMVFFVEGGGG